MKKIALLGAGGKMGVRLYRNLLGSRFDVAHVEVSAEGQQRLKDATGSDCVSQDDALAGADVVVLAVPDRLIGKILHQIISGEIDLESSSTSLESEMEEQDESSSSSSLNELLRCSRIVPF